MAVRARFDPVKLNYLTLGNIVPHLHTHVVPRYRDDPAPGGPIEWAQIFSPAPVPEAELQRQAAGLRVLLASSAIPLAGPPPQARTGRRAGGSAAPAA